MLQSAKTFRRDIGVIEGFLSKHDHFTKGQIELFKVDFDSCWKK